MLHFKGIILTNKILKYAQNEFIIKATLTFKHENVFFIDIIKTFQLKQFFLEFFINSGLVDISIVL